jgi:hypothetical protein
LRDFVGPVDHLGFERAARLETQALDEVEREGEVAPPRGVLQDALADVVRQVQPGFGVAPLQAVDDPDRLVVVLEPPGFRVAFGEQVVEDVLPGVAERRVAQVVPQGDGLGQVLVQAERAGDASGDLRDLDRVGEPGAEVVPFVRNEDLRLVFQPPEGPGVDDPVAVADVLRAKSSSWAGSGPRGLVARALRLA